MKLPNLSVAELRALCAANSGDGSHERYCIELFRGAIVDGRQECWSAVFENYRGLVQSWVVEFCREDDIRRSDELEDLMMAAFAAFWQGYTTEKLDKADGLGSVLRYLKSCVLTEVLQRRRQIRRRIREHHFDDVTSAGQPADEAIQAYSGQADAVDQVVLGRQEANHLWMLVDSCCSDPREHVLARLSFVCDLTPAMIISLLPHEFEDVQEIYRLRRNLRNRLMRNPELQSFEDTHS